MTQNSSIKCKDTTVNGRTLNCLQQSNHPTIESTPAIIKQLEGDLLASMTLANDAEFASILEGIDSIEELCKDFKKISKLEDIDPQVLSRRLDLVKARIKLLECQDNFAPFQEEYRGYLGDFTWEGKSIVVKITAPDKTEQVEETLKDTALNASIYFRRWVNSASPKRSPKKEPASIEVEIELPKPLSAAEQMWLVLDNLVLGQEVIYKNKRGKFTEAHDAPLPMAWVKFNNEAPVAVNPLDVTLFDYQGFVVGQRCDSSTGIVEIEAIKFYVKEESWLPWLLERTRVTRFGTWEELSMIEAIVTEISEIDFINSADFSEIEQKAILYLLNLEASNIL